MMFRQAQHEGGSPSPQPSPIKGEGMSFDRLRMNGGAGSEIATSLTLLAMTGSFDRLRTNGGFTLVC